jgi:uncharacterized membrane protein
MIRIGAVYLLAGLMFAAVAALSLRDRENPKRFGNGLFWGLFAVSFLFGGRLSDFGNGLLALMLAAIGGFRLMGKGRPATSEPADRRHSAERLGNRLFLPALIVPATAMLGTLVLKRIRIGGVPPIDPAQATVISLGLGIVIALAVAMLWLRPALTVPLCEARRLLDSVGWAVVLPQMLAALGAIFAVSGAGEQVGRIVTAHLPGDSRFAAVAAYTVGMAAFTMAVGNAFAAFPVMTAAIGLPVIVRHWGGDPAATAALGMLSGFCGTLMTPMAANFNIVPVALLGLRDRNAVIKAQAPTALGLLAANTLLMYFLVFR